MDNSGYYYSHQLLRRLVINLGRVPNTESDDLTSFNIMLSNCRRFRERLKHHNPESSFYIDFDENNYPVVTTENKEVLVPDKWTD